MHPLFQLEAVVDKARLPLSHEVLNFPEFYIYRQMASYVKYWDVVQPPLTDYNMARLRKAIPSSRDYLQMIIRDKKSDLSFPLNLARNYRDAIISSIGVLLQESKTIFEAIIEARRLSIMSWYTREAFRYGTQSRYSMLYNRGDIDRIVEGIYVAILISCANGEYEVIQVIEKSLQDILDIIDIHDRNAHLSVNYSEKYSRAVYQEQLDEARARTMNSWAELKLVIASERDEANSRPLVN